MGWGLPGVVSWAASDWCLGRCLVLPWCFAGWMSGAPGCLGCLGCLRHGAAWGCLRVCFEIFVFLRKTTLEKLISFVRAVEQRRWQTCVYVMIQLIVFIEIKVSLFFTHSVFFVCSGKTMLEELISFKCGVDGELISSTNQSWASKKMKVSC